MDKISIYKTGFESSVNSEGIETTRDQILQEFTFESSVNSEGIETATAQEQAGQSLRAV